MDKGKKYIDADKLIALLEQRKKQLAQWTDKEYANQRIDEIDCILDVDIDSLHKEPVSEELEEEMERYFEEMEVLKYENIFDVTFQKIARHFAEWGAKHLRDSTNMPQTSE